MGDIFIAVMDLKSAFGILMSAFRINLYNIVELGRISPDLPHSFVSSPDDNNDFDS